MNTIGTVSERLRQLDEASRSGETPRSACRHYRFSATSRSIISSQPSPRWRSTMLVTASCGRSRRRWRNWRRRLGPSRSAPPPTLGESRLWLTHQLCSGERPPLIRLLGGSGGSWRSECGAYMVRQELAALVDVVMELRQHLEVTPAGNNVYLASRCPRCLS